MNLIDYNIKGRSCLKIKKLLKNNLPFGQFKYKVIFNLHILEIYSRKYNLINSYNKPVLYSSKKEIQQYRKKAAKYYRKEIKLVLDKLEDDLQNFSIGKTKIDFKSDKKRPLCVYLTNKEDLTILLMNYQDVIFRIYKISVA